MWAAIAAAVASFALLAAPPADSVAVPAAKEYKPRVPTSKGEEGGVQPASPASAPTAVGPGTPAPATAQKRITEPDRPDIETTVDLGDDDRSWPTAFIDALTDPLVIAVALVALALTAGLRRLRPAD